MTELPITTVATLANGLIFLWLTIRVIAYRRQNKIVLGDNDDRAMTKRIRGQANAAEQMPFALIMLTLCELQGTPALALWIAVSVFTAGRLMHAVYFGLDGQPWQLRLYGMASSLLGFILLLGCLILALI